MYISSHRTSCKGGRQLVAGMHSGENIVLHKRWKGRHGHLPSSIYLFGPSFARRQLVAGLRSVDYEVVKVFVQRLDRGIMREMALMGVLKVGWIRPCCSAFRSDLTAARPWEGWLPSCARWRA